MKNSPFYRFMLVTNRQDTPLTDYLQFIKHCAVSGISAVQLREKQQTKESLLTFGLALKRMLDPLHIPLIINDHIDVAIELNASGVHLGQSDGDPLLARQRLGSDKIIGLSIDSKDQLLAANDLPLDYVGIGAVFPTTSKHHVSTVWGIDGLKKLAKISKHPIVGIGGINKKNTEEVMLAGASGIAVIAALHDADDPSQLTHDLRYMIDKGVTHV